MKRMIAMAIVSAAIMGCSESALSPATTAETDLPLRGGASHTLVPGDTLRFDIVIDPVKGSVWELGEGNYVSFTKGSLCDPNSSYGPTEWDQPCKATKTPLNVHVTEWLDASGHTRVDFSPSVRFAPSTNPKEWVTIVFSDVAASIDPQYNILYCATVAGSCTNEAVTDPSLVTLRDPKTGKLARRIKHFSGYNVAAGRDAEEEGLLDLSTQSAAHLSARAQSISTLDLGINTLDAIRAAHPGISPSEAGDFLERIKTGRGLSGYILASGRDEF